MSVRPEYDAPVANAPAGPQPSGLDREARPLATADRMLHMVGNAHLDPVWLWPWQEGYQEARATFWSAIHRMEEYPDFVFTCDQVALLSWVEECEPELFERIRQRTAEGRWQMAGGWWVEPDCNLPSGESFVRQGLYGQRYLKEKFGVVATVGMNVDPFGHHAMLPQILRGQGMDSYCFMRPQPHEESALPTLFRWRSPDGSEVLGYRIPHEYGSPPGDVSGHVDKTLGLFTAGPAGADDEQDREDVMVFYGVGNHGGGPTRANIESIHRYDRMGTYGRIAMSSPRWYFDHVLARGDDLAALPVWDGDLQHHAPGCYSSHSGIKAWQRRAQAAILSAERWSAVTSCIAGVDYPRSELGGAWKQILFNQFHDVLPGSAIESAYDDARDQLGEAVAVAKRAINRSHNIIARHVDISAQPGTQPVLVFNPHPWPVTAQVELQYWAQPTGVAMLDGTGADVPVQLIQTTATLDDKSRGAIVFPAKLPPLGYRLYRLCPLASRLRDGGEPARRGLLAATATSLENDRLKIGIDPATGWLDSLLDKRTGVDLLAGATGPHTQICADPTDTWGHRVLSYAWPGEQMQTTAQLLIENGPVRAVVSVQRRWGESTLREEFSLGVDSDALEVRVFLDWREPAHLLKLRVPVGLDEPESTYEVPFGTIRRDSDGTENPAQTWVDVSGVARGTEHPTRAGLALVNNAKHGFDVSAQVGTGGRTPSAKQTGAKEQARPADQSSPSIGMTAVRSPVYSWHDPRSLEVDGHYVYQDQGWQRFRYLLVPHDGDWREADLMRRSAELGSPVRAMMESFHPGSLPERQSFADDGAGPVLVTAVKGSEDDGAGGPDLVVRAVETTGRPTRARIELPVVGRTVEADFGAHQIRTFRIPRSVADPVTETDLIEWPLAGGRGGGLSAYPCPDGRVELDRAGPDGPDHVAASDLTLPTEEFAPDPHDDPAQS